MSGRETHTTRIPFHPELVSLRVLLQSPSARHNVRCFPFRVSKLLEPRTQLQSFVLGLYYLAWKDDGHVRGMLEAGRAAFRGHKPSSAPPLYASVSLLHYVYSDSPNYRVP